MKKLLFSFLFSFLALQFAWLFVFVSPVYSQAPGPNNLPARHRGAVTSILKLDDNLFLSAAEDGFLGLWNNQTAIDRFQISPYGLKSMVLRPGKDQIAVVEDDGFSAHRISLWDLEKRENLFTLNFLDSISYINFSSAGSFIIVSLAGQAGVIFIDAESGVIYEPNGIISENISFAATSLSEKVLLYYSPSGVLSYRDLETGNELHHFTVPPNISSPVLFGNFCYLGGFDHNGLIILDTVTGSTLARNNTVNGNLFVEDPFNTNPQGRAHFFCFTSSNTANNVIRMEIDISGRLTIQSRLALPRGIQEISGIISGGGDNFVIGNFQGNLWFWNRTLSKLLDSGNPEMILDLASSSDALGFITGSGLLGFLPLNYSQFRDRETLRLAGVSLPSGNGAYERITAGPSTPSGEGRNTFLFWQNNRTVPMIKKLQGNPLRGEGSGIFLENLPVRFPLRSAAIYRDRILFLNSQGAISILNSENGNQLFSYTSSGAQEAVFINQNIILIGRSAVGGTGAVTSASPFLTVSTVTGETVPLAYPAILGLKVYRGASGAIYGAAVNRIRDGVFAGEIETSVIRINTSNPSLSEKLAEYKGEDSSFFICESGGNSIFNPGGGAATLYRNQSRDKLQVERSRGLPQKAADAGNSFIILDGDGGLCWHDNRTGKLQAVFKLYQNHWTLDKNGTLVTGPVVRN